VYAFILSFLLLAVRLDNPLRHQIAIHIDALLFFGWGIYLYQSLCVLAVKEPTLASGSSGALQTIGWSRIALLTATVVAISPLIEFKKRGDLLKRKVTAQEV
jgi:hypothetical protein